ncbi:MAG: sheath polysaccharide-degrading [Gammaproteobacteria bacterium]|nr:sheath polysaccharide-degrading [Gammaproteobacteria bacterium]
MWFSVANRAYSPPPIILLPTGADPVTAALNATASGHRYDVHSVAAMDVVPWATLGPGDVVNIFNDDATGLTPTVYARKFALRAQGTSTDPVIINGVTDYLGNRPVLNFSGANTCPSVNPSGSFGGPNDIFTNSPQFGESLGGIVVKRGPSDAYGVYEPQWMQFKNLELHGAANGNTYHSITGTTPAYASAGGIYLLLAQDTLLENLKIYDNGFGIFTMAKDGLGSEACKRLTIRNCRVFGNGVSGSFLEHNFYVQCFSPIIEGNYIGQTRAGSQGSTYKSRSSGEIFRYNYVVASARAMDFVHSEDNNPGISTDPVYGVTYVYGNTILNDFNTGKAALAAVHFGGDNEGEDGATGTALIDPTTFALPYRVQMCFWNNTYIQRATQAQSFRTQLFGIALKNIRVDLWDNTFVLDGSSNWQAVQYAGQLHWWANNVIYSLNGAPALANAHDQADATKYAVTFHTAALTGNPLFVNYTDNDFHLAAGSSAIDQAAGQPSGANMPWPPASVAGFPNPSAYLNPSTFGPPSNQFKLNNQTVGRPTQGAANDIGAFEAGIT